MKHQLYLTKILFFSSILLIASLGTQNTYAMEEEEIKNNVFCITSITNTTNRKFICLIDDNESTEIEAGKIKNFNKKLKLKCCRPKEVVTPYFWPKSEAKQISFIKKIYILDPQTKKRFLQIIITKEVQDTQNEFFVTLVDLVNKKTICERNGTWWKYNASEDETCRLNIGLILKKGNNGLESSKLNISYRAYLD
ncbi:MAG TPA: hypothetical protein ENI08_02140 [Candidatus Dependentiae bacterium]|nr:hypothetical protein [Candidatus Dependentiae bacterium]